MPVTIGVFVTPGRVKAPDGRGARPLQPQLRIRRPRRRLRPVPARRTAARGRDEDHRRRPADPASRRTATTARSAAPAAARSRAFTAAWERPDAFRRVFSAIGTYVGLRGGNVYPDADPQGTSRSRSASSSRTAANDLNIYGGDWWMANQEMERALDLRRLRGRTTPGATAATTASTRTEIFPDAMRWLWKDWPAPVKAGAGSPQLQEILIPGEGWQLVAEGYKFTEGPGRQRQGRGLLQRRRRQQDLQGRPRRQGEPCSSPTRRRATARRSAPTAGSTPSPAAPSRSSPTTPTGKADGRSPRASAATTWSSATTAASTSPTPAGTATSRARSGTSARRARRRSSTPG